MFVVALACCLLVVVSTVLHHEVLNGLNAGLPALRIPNRAKLVVVILAAGSLVGTTGFLLANCMYFSAETYTSLGFGDLTPHGPVRVLAGVEALTGLLLIGWSASFTYISMERFWTRSPAGPGRGDRE